MFIINLDNDVYNDVYNNVYNDMNYYNYIYNDINISEIEEQIINVIDIFEKNKDLFYITLIFIFIYLFIMFFPIFKNIKFNSNKFLMLLLNITKFFLITGLII